MTEQQLRHGRHNSVIADLVVGRSSPCRAWELPYNAMSFPPIYRGFGPPELSRTANCWTRIVALARDPSDELDGCVPR
jgi:hypothetical protein